MIVSAVLVMSFLATQSDAPVFKDGFDGGLKAPWRVVDGAPVCVDDPGNAGGRVLELVPNSRVLLDLTPPLEDVVVEARVRFVEKMSWVEAPILIRAEGNRAVQVYLEQTKNQVIAVRYGTEVTPLTTAASPVPLEVGKWYAVKIVARGQRIGVWVDGAPAVAAVDREPRAGSVGMRVGDARTQYDDVVVRTPSPEECAALFTLDYPEQPAPVVQALRFGRIDGGEGTLTCPDAARPLQPFTCQLQDAGPGTYELKETANPGNKAAFSADGSATVCLSGAEGERSFTLARDGVPVASFVVHLEPATTWQTDRFNSSFETLRGQVDRDRSLWKRNGREIAANPTWVRDHIHEMKAYKYWEKDITSFVDTLIELQHPEGFYYEIIGEATHDHQEFVKPKHFLREDDKDLCWIRLELEADVEYLMVEAAHQIWQATGDDKAMAQRLPSLERALEYDFTDPTRWDAEHGALKRPFTIDTWDFTYGISDQNRKIEPGIPMGIMHGDNSGLYRACLELADMLRATGNTDRAGFWQKRGEDLRERINKLCFNGNYYTHQILLQPVDTGVREEDILSLSNTYDINRGLPTHEMALKIIDEYQRRRAALGDACFAEWFSINPPYPKFGPYEAGRYINGGVVGFGAGELAKAAFHHGREAYAADILNRVDQLVQRDGAIRFLYDTAGKDIGGGPSGWSAAAVISALVEGLAGIRDDATLFRTVTVAPRFPVAAIGQAYVCLRYGPGGAYVAMDYTNKDKCITIRLCGDPEMYHLRVLLPDGVTTASLRNTPPGAVVTGVQTVESARYFVLDIPAPNKKSDAVVCELEY